MLKRKWGVVLHGLLHDCIQPCYVVAKIAHVKTCFSLAQAVEPGNEARLVLINWSFFFSKGDICGISRIHRSYSIILITCTQ